MPSVRRPGKSYAPKSAGPRSAVPRPDSPRPGAAPGTKGRGSTSAAGPAAAAKRPGDDHPILFQKFFKSANPQRTYAAQVKQATNGNHYLVLTEGKRDDATGEVRKTRLFIYSEDFPEFFKMLQATAIHIRQNPVPDEIKQKRQRFWAKKNAEGPAASPPPTPAAGNGAAARAR